MTQTGFTVEDPQKSPAMTSIKKVMTFQVFGKRLALRGSVGEGSSVFGRPTIEVNGLYWGLDLGGIAL